MNGDANLHIATYYGRTDVVKLLLADPRIDVNIRDKDSWTTLHYAVCRGQMEVTALFQ